MTLRIFNVLGREKQAFSPIHEGRVGMYVCGPTVYEHSHLGHAKTYVSFDVVARYLRYRGFDLLYVQNITDVGHLRANEEDRILVRAAQLNAKPMQIVETYARSYFEDMDALGVRRPDISPRASGHVPEQIEMIETLLDRGHAYVANGNVYFDVLSDADYGKLSNRRVDEQHDESRELVAGEKRHPADFALWRMAEPEHILRWNSPWGVGFPGWHIECSAMAKKYLGANFDIHGGGIDNIYPHNENEIAQSECANDVGFANFWMLTGSLNVLDPDEGIPVKMSKSLGNYITIKDALEAYRPQELRYFILTSHYSNPVVYSDEALASAKSGWERLMNALRLLRQQLNSAPETDAGAGFLERLVAARAEFNSVMDDDFNSPRGIAALQDLTRDVNTLLNSETEVGVSTLAAIEETYTALAGDVLGLAPAESAEGGDGQREGALIEMLIEMRARARAERDYARSDQIRDQLAALGINLEDRADGTVWKLN
ncbi:MAG: cysteine--tRNA ligase [Chloroflexota bacterium]|nr:cysteine--tRNA ligase [Chloroflexota bacterium]MDE2909243.1 cysteine--tRNA ligase [Chloroflexota bacterium]